MLPEIHRVRAHRIADALVVAIAAALPWSTSASAILIALWIVAALAALERDVVRTTPLSAAGVLPAVLWLLAALGMVWAAEASWAERFEGLRAYHKLLLVPLLLVHFSRSDKGGWAAAAFLVSCTVLLALSFLFAAVPELTWRFARAPGIPVRDRIAQSGEFVLCAFALVALAGAVLRRGQARLAAALIGLAALFLFNVFYVVVSRTALVLVPVLAIVLGLRLFGVRGMVAAAGAAAVIALVAWTSSAPLRERVLGIEREIDIYVAGVEAPSSAGERLDYWRKSLTFIAAAPVVGHGTGSMRALFRHAAAGQTGIAGQATENPHNQTLAVAIELGLLGTGALWAMWLAHLLLFRGEGLAATFGLLVVVQTIVSALFNTHLADFSQGWLYVFGVGIFGGMMLRRRWRDGAMRAPGQPG